MSYNTRKTSEIRVSSKIYRTALTETLSQVQQFFRKFLSLPSKIVPFRLLRTPPVMTPLKTRSYSQSHSEYQGLLTFRIQYKVFKEGRKFILARLHLGEYLALASLSISDGT